MTVAVLGSINVDVTAYLERLPRPGETLHGREYKIGLGGKGANQAVAARKLGSDVRLIARTGEDQFGEAARRELAAYGLDLAAVAVDRNGSTGIAIINVGETGENFISVIGGVNHAIDAGDVKRERSIFEISKVLLLQLETPVPASLEAAKIVWGAGGTVILDPAPAPKSLESGVLEMMDILTPNESEAAAILGWRPADEDGGIRAAVELRSAGVPAAIVKLGAIGVAVASSDGEWFCPAFEVGAVDTVAAGDSFNGGLAHALEEGRTLAEAVRFASACGALSTTRKGASAAAPTRREVEQFLAHARLRGK
jgi:ribokinase